jgi:hypothetical protein
VGGGLRRSGQVGIDGVAHERMHEAQRAPRFEYRDCGERIGRLGGDGGIDCAKRGGFA